MKYLIPLLFATILALSGCHAEHETQDLKSDQTAQDSHQNSHEGSHSEYGSAHKRKSQVANTQASNMQAGSGHDGASHNNGSGNSISHYGSANTQNLPHDNSNLGNSAQNQNKQFTCPMHPHYIATDPQGQCPICGMNLVPVTSQNSPDHSVTVSPEMIQTMGIRTDLVKPHNFHTKLRAFGTVTANTRLESLSASRLEGWIKDLTARAQGDAVRRGQRLYSIYAPELIAAQKDYLASLQIGNARRIAAVKSRLKSKGMQDQLITTLTERRTLIEDIPIYAENTGIITALHIRDGDYVKAGDPILRLQNYKSIWVIAALAEQDLPYVSEGQSASLRFKNIPHRVYDGVVDYIYPTIDQRTRSASLRITLDNRDRQLKPGAYADITFQSGAAHDQDNNPQAQSHSLAIPSAALLRDSRGSHVIMALGEGHFRPQRVNIGRNVDGYSEVISGLTLGDEIVTHGQFMLDSEASLRSGFAAHYTDVPIFSADTPLADLPINADNVGQIDHIIDTALYFHDTLIMGHEIDPTLLEPVLIIIADLQMLFRGSELSPILDAAKVTLEQAKATSSQDALSQNLASLMHALGPWLMQGRPSHYAQKGLLYYQDNASQQRWIQLRRDNATAPSKPVAANPYGDGPARLIDWPNLMEDESMTESNPSPIKGSKQGPKP